MSSKKKKDLAVSKVIADRIGVGDDAKENRKRFHLLHSQRLSESLEWARSEREAIRTILDTFDVDENALWLPLQVALHTPGLLIKPSTQSAVECASMSRHAQGDIAYALLCFVMLCAHRKTIYEFAEMLHSTHSDPEWRTVDIFDDCRNFGGFFGGPQTGFRSKFDIDLPDIGFERLPALLGAAPFYAAEAVCTVHDKGNVYNEHWGVAQQRFNRLCAQLELHENVRSLAVWVLMCKAFRAHVTEMRHARVFGDDPLHLMLTENKVPCLDVSGSGRDCAKDGFAVHHCSVLIPETPPEGTKETCARCLAFAARIKADDAKDAHVWRVLTWMFDDDKIRVGTFHKHDFPLVQTPDQFKVCGDVAQACDDLCHTEFATWKEAKVVIEYAIKRNTETPVEKLKNLCNALQSILDKSVMVEPGQELALLTRELDGGFIKKFAKRVQNARSVALFGRAVEYVAYHVESFCPDTETPHLLWPANHHDSVLRHAEALMLARLIQWITPTRFGAVPVNGGLLARAKYNLAMGDLLLTPMADWTPDLILRPNALVQCMAKSALIQHAAKAQSFVGKPFNEQIGAARLAAETLNWMHFIPMCIRSDVITAMMTKAPLLAELGVLQSFVDHFALLVYIIIQMTDQAMSDQSDLLRVTPKVVYQALRMAHDLRYEGPDVRYLLGECDKDMTRGLKTILHHWTRAQTWVIAFTSERPDSFGIEDDKFVYPQIHRTDALYQRLQGIMRFETFTQADAAMEFDDKGVERTVQRHMFEFDKSVPGAGNVDATCAKAIDPKPVQISVAEQKGRGDRGRDETHHSHLWKLMSLAEKFAMPEVLPHAVRSREHPEVCAHLVQNAEVILRAWMFNTHKDDTSLWRHEAGGEEVKHWQALRRMPRTTMSAYVDDLRRLWLRGQLATPAHLWRPRRR